MFLIQYAQCKFINAEEITNLDCTMSAGNNIFFKIKNENYVFMVSKDYEDSFLNEFKNLDDNNPGNKLTKHNYK